MTKTYKIKYYFTNSNNERISAGCFLEANSPEEANQKFAILQQNKKNIETDILIRDIVQYEDPPNKMN